MSTALKMYWAIERLGKWSGERRKKKERRQAHKIYTEMSVVWCCTMYYKNCILFSIYLDSFCRFFPCGYISRSFLCSLKSLLSGAQVHHILLLCHCMYFSYNGLNILFVLDLFIGQTSCVWLRCNDRSIVQSNRLWQ